MKDPLWDKVVEYNWLDSALFDYFNNSLWDRIALERRKRMLKIHKSLGASDGRSMVMIV